MYAFKCGDDINYKLKGVSKSQSKHFKVEEYKKCLDGEDYQIECNIHFLRSINHEMYLQEAKTSKLSIFDDKSIYFSNLKSLPWN